LRHTHPFSFVFLALAYAVGGTANHNLFLAIHEITHNLAFKGVNANKALAVFANLPIGIPYAAAFKVSLCPTLSSVGSCVRNKRYHLEHHKHLGEDGIDTDLPTNFELLCLNNVLGKTFFAYVAVFPIILCPVHTLHTSTFQIFFYALRPGFVRTQAFTKWHFINIVSQLTVDLILVRTFGLRPLLYLLFSSFFAGSLHPCAGHFIAEHYVWDGLEQETYSYYGPLNILAYNVSRNIEECLMARRNNGERSAITPYVALRVPATLHRPPRVDTDTRIERPYIPRATYAPSAEKPRGSEKYSAHYHEYSVMQQHCLYWDRDGDGIIWPIDTWVGFRDLGFNILFSFLAVLVIHSTLSIPTRLPVSYVPDPFFRIYIDHIHKDKHGSDSGSFDSFGRFIPSRFEDIWTEYARRSPGELPRTKMTVSELWEFISGNRVAWDPFGWIAGFLEWFMTFLLVQQKGEVDKEDVRKVLDGSIFFEIREARKTGAGWNKGWGLGGDGFIGDEKVSTFGL
ncbi:hypothetical protein ID866_8817, partial [Astraeus odoratus]